MTGLAPNVGALAQITRPPLEWDWIRDNWGILWTAGIQHLVLTAWAVGLGFLLALALAVVARRYRRTYAPILSLGGVLYTIPSLAAFALLWPFFGFTMPTAVIPLASYTLLILTKNLVDGIDGVPAEVVEAATAMGYRPTRLFLTIQLPLAAPVVIAGIRVATVTVIGLVTVTALLGMGGLGQVILRGFRVTPPHPTMILAGTFLSVVLALVMDFLLLSAERALTPWQRRGRS
jgi:osmoprotectant transport system permease protein